MKGFIFKCITVLSIFIANTALAERCVIDRGLDSYGRYNAAIVFGKNEATFMQQESRFGEENCRAKSNYIVTGVSFITEYRRKDGQYSNLYEGSYGMTLKAGNKSVFGLTGIIKGNGNIQHINNTTRTSEFNGKKLKYLDFRVFSHNSDTGTCRASSPISVACNYFLTGGYQIVVDYKKEVPPKPKYKGKCIIDRTLNRSYNLNTIVPFIYGNKELLNINKTIEHNSSPCGITHNGIVTKVLFYPNYLLKDDFPSGEEVSYLPGEYGMILSAAGNETDVRYHGLGNTPVPYGINNYIDIFNGLTVNGLRFKVTTNNNVLGACSSGILQCNRYLIGGYSILIEYESDSKIIMPTIPKNVKVKAFDNNKLMHVYWDDSELVHNYILQVSINGSKWKELTTGHKRQYDYLGEGEKSYSFRVKACTEDRVCSNWSDKTDDFFFLAPEVSPPSKISIEKKRGEISLHWGKVENADYYIKQVSYNSQGWTNTQKIEDLSYIETNNSHLGSLYKYRLKSCTFDNNCSSWAYSEIITILDKPNSIKSSLIGNVVNIKWSKVLGAEYYLREMSFDGNNWIHQKRIINNSVSYNNQNDGVRYYRVSACSNYNICSEWSKSSLPLLLPDSNVVLREPGFVKAYLTGNTVHINWEDITGADYYIREMSFNGKQWFHPKKIKGTSISYSNQNGGVRYYRVAACSISKKCSGWSKKSEPVYLPK